MGGGRSTNGPFELAKLEPGRRTVTTCQLCRSDVAPCGHSNGHSKRCGLASTPVGRRQQMRHAGCERTCEANSLRRHCPDQVDGGRRLVFQLAGLSAFRLPRPSRRPPSILHPLGRDHQGPRSHSSMNPWQWAGREWLGQATTQRRVAAVPTGEHRARGVQRCRSQRLHVGKGQRRLVGVRSHLGPGGVGEVPGEDPR